MDLHLGRESIGSVIIRRGLFQGDSVSPIHFVASLIPLSLLLNASGCGYQLTDSLTVNHRVHMDDLKLYGSSERELKELLRITSEFSNDIGMKFGMDKCAVIRMVKGKRRAMEGIEVGEDTISEVGEGGYKYLGILEADQILNQRKGAH